MGLGPSRILFGVSSSSSYSHNIRLASVYIPPYASRITWLFHTLPSLAADRPLGRRRPPPAVLVVVATADAVVSVVAEVAEDAAAVGVPEVLILGAEFHSDLVAGTPDGAVPYAEPNAGVRNAKDMTQCIIKMTATTVIKGTLRALTVHQKYTIWMISLL